MVVCDNPAPEKFLGKCFKVEAGDDAEITGAAFEGFKEVSVVSFVCAGYCARWEDDLYI
jgi:hypothetical protein